MKVEDKTKKVKVNLIKKIDSSYDILIGENFLDSIPRDLKKLNIGNRFLIITDDIIRKMYGEKILGIFRKEGLKADILSIKSGEESKNIKVFSCLISEAHKLGIDRKSAVIAFGGGVAGDIAGFVAASYMRGIPYVQIPTTLLAMVDSSIGGKVAVDIESGKNICGVFYQPKRVYIDVSFLDNLPEKQIANGMAEIIKHGLILDIGYIGFIEKSIRKIFQKDKETLVSLIESSCRIKASIVEKDEMESGCRKLVNYGHTLGHAIESCTKYKKYSHGEAISMGMAAAARLSFNIGLLQESDMNRQNSLLKKALLPTIFPKLDINKIISIAKGDKKASSGKIEFVLLEKIGKARYGIQVSEEEIKKAIRESQ